MEATRLLPDIDMPLRSLAGLLWTPRCEPGSHEAEDENIKLAPSKNLLERRVRMEGWRQGPA